MAYDMLWYPEIIDLVTQLSDNRFYGQNKCEKSYFHLKMFQEACIVAM